VTVNGIDVANYQGSGYSTTGLDFVFVKATEGHSYTNPKHAAQVATARAAGLVVGHYHFMRPGSPTAQASHFLAHAKPHPGDMLACDWEDTGVSCADKDAFIRAVQKAQPDLRTGLYANRDFWLHRDSTSFCGSFLWIADPSAPKGHPRVEHPWLFHQYSEAGGLDRDLGNFTDRAALQRWAGSTSTEDTVADLTPTTPIRVADWVATRWPHAPGDDPHTITVGTALGSGYGHARRAADAAEQAVAQLAALTAAFAALVKDGGLTAEQITAAAKAGADEALAQLGAALTTED
jgi:GH25 family lysozyme M1 (1,4-beta-N-acetylmuramidase)